MSKQEIRAKLGQVSVDFSESNLNFIREGESKSTADDSFRRDFHSFLLNSYFSTSSSSPFIRLLLLYLLPGSDFDR